jgi:hypothetical protein
VERHEHDLVEFLLREVGVELPPDLALEEVLYFVDP